MSRAVDRCPSAVSPLAFLKVVLSIPKLARRAGHPLGEGDMVARDRVANGGGGVIGRFDGGGTDQVAHREIFCPGFRPRREGGCEAAYFDMVTLVSSVMRPASIS